MTCIRIPNGFICGPDIIVYLCFDATTWTVEWHHYFGPLFYKLGEWSAWNRERWDQDIDPPEFVWDFYYSHVAGQPWWPDKGGVNK